MTLEAFLRRIVTLLEQLRIPYMLTGSIAAAYYAEPRATRDLDLVIGVSPAEIEHLLERLDTEGFYVSHEAAREALERPGQFNAVDPDSGWKVDWIVRKDRPFSRSEFDRRRPVHLADLDVPLVTAEDLIVAKLEWAQKGSSELQLRDVVAILLQHTAELDRAYIERWVDELQLQPEWRAVLDEAEREEG